MTKCDFLIPALHRRIDEALKKKEYRFPTEEALCREFAVSRVTMRKALAALEEEGLLRRHQGSGSYLTGKSPDPSGNSLALLLASPLRYRSPVILEQARRAAAEAGFSLAVYNMHSSFQTERQILLELLANPPRGLLLESFSAIPDPNTDLLMRLIGAPLSVPAVSLPGPVRIPDASLPGAPAILPIPFAAEDSLQGARLLVRTLTQLGHRRIAGIFSSCAQPDAARFQSWMTALREEGLPMHPDLFLLPGNPETGEIANGTDARLSAFLQKVTASCTALVCSDDLLAAAVLQKLPALGLRVPEDFSLASFEGSYLQRLSPIHTASLVGTACLGECSVHLLLQKLRGETPESLLLPLSLEKGNSLRSV